MTDLAGSTTSNVFYGDLAPWWPLISAPDEYVEEAAFAAELLAAAEPPTRTVLELGSGGGSNAFHLKTEFDLTLVDLSPEMVARCRAKGLEAYERDFLHLGFEPASFDAVYAMNCLLHVPNADLPEVLRAVRTVLKPGGLFYLGVYGGRDFEGIKADDRCDPPRFFSFFRDEDLLKVVGAIFEVVSFKPLTVGTADRLEFQSCVLRKPPSP